MRYSQIICSCCMGAGAHERYIPDVDRWTQEDCTACEGKGYITPDRSDELWELSGLKPMEVKYETVDKQGGGAFND